MLLLRFWLRRMRRREEKEEKEEKEENEGSAWTPVPAPAAPRERIS